jgi:hypothetical protein
MHACIFLVNKAYFIPLFYFVARPRLKTYCQICIQLEKQSAANTFFPVCLYAYDNIFLFESSVVFIQKHAVKEVSDSEGPTKIQYSLILLPRKRKASTPESTNVV